MKRLSIIIVTYNSEHDIYDCLASIRKHQDLQPEELEIIIVDNNSRDTDGMFAKLRELYGNDIVLVKNTHNGGYGQGNNVGIRMATAPVILIMNPDVRLLMPIFKTATDAFLEDSRLAMYGMKQMLTEQLLLLCLYRQRLSADPLDLALQPPWHLHSPLHAFLWLMLLHSQEDV